MELSILVCATPIRRNLLSRVLGNLIYQIKRDGLQDRVEILVYMDNFKKSIASKRNKLLKEARGKYVVYVDDDDDVAKNYLRHVLKAMQTNPDYIGYKVRTTWEGDFIKPTYHSMRFKRVYEDKRGSYRNVSHINPIRATIAKRFKFVDLPRAEDDEWCSRIYNAGLIKSQVVINKFLYHYYFSPQFSLGTVEQTEKNREKSRYEIPFVDFDDTLVRNLGMKTIKVKPVNKVFS